MKPACRLLECVITCSYHSLGTTFNSDKIRFRRDLFPLSYIYPSYEELRLIADPQIKGIFMNRASGTKTSFLFLPATFTFFSLTKGRKGRKRRGKHLCLLFFFSSLKFVLSTLDRSQKNIPVLDRRDRRDLEGKTRRRSFGRRMRSSPV